MKVKHITDIEEKLEKEINLFLEEKSVKLVDIKYSTTPLSAECFAEVEYSALIIYEEITIEENEEVR